MLVRTTKYSHNPYMLYTASSKRTTEQVWQRRGKHKMNAMWLRKEKIR